MAGSSVTRWGKATEAERAALRPELWPVERPEGQELGADTRELVRRGWLYVEAVGNGWVRVGLTDAGREVHLGG